MTYPLNMTKFFFVFFLCLFCCLTAHTQTIEIAVSEWAPVEYSVNGEAKGYHPDIVRETFALMGIKPVFTFYPWKRCVALIQSKKVQGILSLQRLPEREEYLIFPKENISISENIIFVRKGKEFGITKMKDLNGKRIGVTAGYDYGIDFNEAIKYRLFETEEAKTDELNFKKLEAGRIDYFVCDRTVGITLAKSLGLQDIIAVLPLSISSVKMYFAFSKIDENQALADRFDGALLELKKSGKWQKIIDSYLKLQ